nr:hypothetical protein GCM10020241_49920 [Streptoalloteichus tenebrarius]
MRRRRIRPLTTLIALAAAAGLALSGCGDGGSAPAGGESSGQGAERVVKHAMGETKVPANPRRVVVLDTGELDSVLALGITPVGAVTTEVSSDFPAYLKDRLRDTKRVGTIPEPNLDKITEARPDLILSNKVRHAQLYDKLSQIAPTVFADQIGATWKETFLLDAEALGKKDEAEKLLGQYRDRARQVGQQLGDPATKKVSAVRFVTGSQTIRALHAELVPRHGPRRHRRQPAAVPAGPEGLPGRLAGEHRPARRRRAALRVLRRPGEVRGEDGDRDAAVEVPRRGPGGQGSPGRRRPLLRRPRPAGRQQDPR